MREIEKMMAGMEYDFWDDEVNALKANAMDLCKKLNEQNPKDEEKIAETLRELFGSCGEIPWTGPNFHCDNGKNIHVGKYFIANYNVTILDIREVRIGDHCMIGPNTLITTVNHPLLPSKRRAHMGIAEPVTIKDDVWIGGNVTILPGVTIGNNVVVAAGAVVTKDVEDNCVVAGVPAKVIKKIEDDIKR